MTDPNIYYLSESPDREFVYNNETQELFYQVPLAFTRYNVQRNADKLYTDDDTAYFTYSGGQNITTVAKQKDGRYKNVSLRAYSGDSFKFYFNIGDDFNASGIFLSGPLTTSGSYSTLTQYTNEVDAQTNIITFTAPANNSTVYTFPSVQNIRYIRLYHEPVSASGTYRLYQFLPRTLIQVDDLEADVIDVVTLRVSDSIVIGPNLIEDKSILGRKIADGTVSGVLITDGTVTGSKIVANTISGSLITAGTITFDKIASKTLTASQIADATITGSNIVAGTVSGVLITDNAISANKIQANTITGDKIVANTISGSLITAGTITGDKITAATISGSLITASTLTGDKIVAGTISGSLIAANTITANKLSVSQLDAVAANMGTLTVNSGITVSTNGYITAGKTKINTNGMSVGSLTDPLVSGSLPGLNSNVLTIVASGTSGDMQGIAMFNVAHSTTSPQASINLDGTTTLEIANNVESNDASVHVNFKDTYTGAFRIWNGNLDLKRSPASPPNIPAGAIRGYDSDDTVLYEVSPSRLSLKSTADTTIFNVEASTGAVTITGDVAVNTNKVSITASNGNTDIRGNLTVSGSISHRDIGSLARTTNQSVNAGVSAQMQLTTAGTGNITGSTSTYNVTVQSTGFFFVNASVSSATTNLPWRVNQNATSYTTGTTVLTNLTFNGDGREVGTRLVYLTAGDTLGLYINNTSAGAVNFTGTLRVARVT